MLSRVAVLRRGFASLAVNNLKLGAGAPLAAVGKEQVAIAMVASPVHRADRKAGTGIGGMEGVGKVTAVGAGVNNLRAGDWVVPPLGFGAWRSEAIIDASSVTRVSYYGQWWCIKFEKVYVCICVNVFIGHAGGSV